MNRIRISGTVINRYEQVIELTNGELIKFRRWLNGVKLKGDQAIDDCLGDNYADVDPIDADNAEWSAELIDNDNKVIEYLDA